MEISVIIITKNEEERIGATLEMVFRQKLDESYEVIVIDSGSHDGTLKIVRNYPVKVVSINPEDFGHGKTRNFGVKLSQGACVVFLTADALPSSNAWLKNLILPFKHNPYIAGVYSRQMPRSGCYCSEARDIAAGAGVLPKIKSLNSADPQQVGNFNKNIWKFIAFSNISSAYRRDLLERYPFAENLPAVEDQAWAYRLMQEGYSIYYEPASCVYHSHNDTLKKLYSRHYRYGLAFKTFVSDRSRAKIDYFIKVTLYEAVKDYFFLFTYPQSLVKKTVWIFKIPLFRIIKNYAFYQGFKDAA